MNVYMVNLNMNCIPFLPIEIINAIADFHDYQKYCKPKHSRTFQYVVADIVKMGTIMDFISPKIAYNCWGPGSKYLYSLSPSENFNPDEETWSSDEEDSNDDEENNFGLDYDDTYYYTSEEVI